MSKINDEIEKLKKQVHTLSKEDPNFAHREEIVEEFTTFLQRNGIAGLLYRGNSFAFEIGDCTIHARPMISFLETCELYGKTAILYEGGMSGFDIILKFGPMSTENYKRCLSLIPCMPDSDPVADWARFDPNYEILEINLR